MLVFSCQRITKSLLLPTLWLPIVLLYTVSRTPRRLSLLVLHAGVRLISRSQRPTLPVSRDKMTGRADQITPEFPLPVTWVSPAYTHLQYRLDLPDDSEPGPAVTRSSMSPWSPLTQQTPSMLLSSLSGPVSASKPKSGSLSREVTIRQARLRSQQVRDFRQQNPKATQSYIASPSDSEYLVKLR
jgi:hypothetical protein